MSAIPKLTVITCFALVAFGCERPDRISGSLSSIDLTRITKIVHLEAAKRGHGFVHVKTIDETNGIVEVWYADKFASGGEAGYELWRVTNEWRIMVQLFR